MIKKILSIILSVAVALTMIPLLATVSYAENAEADYLTFTSSGSTTVSFAHWADSTNLQYSIDGGVNWNVANSETKIPLGDGETVKFKGEGGNVFSNDNYLRFNIDGEEDGTIAASGSVMSLFGNATECTPYCCWKMFQFCDKLTEAPELPAIKMAEACYGMMFQSCSGLTKTPELPATDLAANCYMHMFSYCDELTDLPDLPATVLPSGCYAYMFLDCSNIKIREGYKPLKNSCYVKYRIPAEGTGEAVDKSMSDMFKNTDCDFGGTPEINKEYYVTHKLTHHELSPATFTRAGNIEYWSCDRCGRLFSEKVTERETAKEITQEKTVIPQINMESITLSQAAYDYDGQAKIPAVSVADTKGNKLTAGADYVVSYANNVNAGTGTAIINFIGNYAGETQKTFTIECDHSYSAPKYLWTDDLSECTAYRICTKDCGTVEKEVATAVKDGNNMKATFTNEAFGTKTMPIPGSEHQHTFADTWSKNSEYHWHAATCGCTGLVNEFAEHAWGTGDNANKCTVCGYEKEDPKPVHEHTFASDWSKNALAHWHAATCGCSGLTNDFAEHNYSTSISKGVKTYTCKTCGYQKKETLKVAVPKPSIKSLTKARKAFTVKWTKKSVTGYQIQYATNSKFTKSKKTVTVKSASTVSKKIKSLKKKKRYYVRVRCYINKYDTTYYSGWSSRKSVRTR